jgi:hypothetical protein
LEEREWNVPFLISIPASPQNEKMPRLIAGTGPTTYHL